MHFHQLRLLPLSLLPALMRQTVEIRRSSNVQRSCCASHEESETRYVELNIPHNSQMSTIERHACLIVFLCSWQSIALLSYRQFHPIWEASVIRKKIYSSRGFLPESTSCLCLVWEGLTVLKENCNAALQTLWRVGAKTCFATSNSNDCHSECKSTKIPRVRTLAAGYKIYVYIYIYIYTYIYTYIIV